jgi:HSP20 family protein
MADIKEAPRPKTEATTRQGQAEVQHPLGVPGAGNGDPLSFMHRFADEMDRLFEGFGLRMPNFFGPGRRPEIFLREPGRMPAVWSPRVDISEQEGQLRVRADLPGLSKDDVQVELTDEFLTIRGERKQQKSEEGKGYCYSECSYGSFFRAIPLPEGIDSSKATADFRNGVLEVSIPAPQKVETKSRRLEIQEKK